MTIKNKRQVFFDTLDLKNSSILGSVWHHFLTTDEQIYGYQDDAIIAKNITAQQQFFAENQPDFVKIMSDAFLLHPSILDTEINHVEDFNKIESLGPNHPWITKQVAAIKTIVTSYHNQIAAIYNIFSPAYYFRLKFDMVDNDRTKFPRLVEENPYLFSLALDKISADLTILIDQLFTEAKIDGIYLCVQSVQSPSFDEKTYQQYIEPTQIKILQQANHYSNYNVLHICGFEGRTNHLQHFAHYPVKAVNWASCVEHVSLEEGKKVFPNRAIIGGFNNTSDGILYHGNKLAIEMETLDILAKNGKKGLLLGADCSVPFDMDFANIKYAVNVANK